MTNYLDHSALPIMDFDFPSKMHEEISYLINNLKMKDVESEKSFNNTLSNLKNKFLVKPVSFEKPKIIEHYQIEKVFPRSFENPWGDNKRNVYVITVEIKFTGDPQLFQYRPNGYTHGSEANIIYQPRGKNIIIEVDTVNLEDKNKVFSEVQHKMSMTYQFIDKNNEFIKNWNKSIEPIIEEKLNAHKIRLEKLYK